jgi:hypothetical protein
MFCVLENRLVVSVPSPHYFPARETWIGTSRLRNQGFLGCWSEFGCLRYAFWTLGWEIVWCFATKRLNQAQLSAVPLPFVTSGLNSLTGEISVITLTWRVGGHRCPASSSCLHGL